MAKEPPLKLDTSALIQPARLVFPPPWVGHIPFAAWLVAQQRPGLLVELGTHSGNSYCAFCQSMVENKVDAKAIAVDTWQGDEHSFRYGEEILANLSEHHDPRYGHFSKLLRTTFDDASKQVEDGSVDLLHIDGLHTYEAVRHDFDTWLPKLSARGVVLLHDTHVFERNFGVHQLLAELHAVYPAFSFPHSHGLGVVLVGENRDSLLLQACEDPQFAAEMQEIFGRLGASVLCRYERDSLLPELAETSMKLDEHRRSVHEYSILVRDLRESEERLRLQLRRRSADLDALASVLDAVRGELHDVYAAAQKNPPGKLQATRNAAGPRREPGSKDQ